MMYWHNSATAQRSRKSPVSAAQMPISKGMLAAPPGNTLSMMNFTISTRREVKKEAARNPTAARASQPLYGARY
ncbi:MAG: hypothetical protein BWZ10_01736 [candidate division BRC1 bacterium ADurb.BinA364]|nr:MAG: hypothetical protein BWZ10_01736 [candidate division BRC1 bacterium ADurb.BinA364]